MVPSAVVSDFHELLHQIKTCIGEIGPELWFRGQPRADFHLVPGVHRDGRNRAYEVNVALRFRRAAPTRHAPCPSRDDHGAWLQLMQHYRLPTRLLDWTQSPLIALFFAVTQDNTAPGALWVLSPFGLNESQVKESVVFNTVDPRVEELIAASLNIAHPSSPHTLATFGEEFDLRMTMQLSAFTIHGNGQALDEHPAAAQFLRRIEIPVQVKQGLREVLTLLGIRRSTVFPDLENLAGEMAALEFQGP
jgi:hypothetical protein